jgi:type II secretory pathway component GspD/PulD (secretin)
LHRVLRLRASDGLEAQLLQGERLPIIIGDVDVIVEEEDDPADGFIPNIQYEDVGVVVHATPRFHAGREITLHLDIALRSVKSPGEGGRPIFANRQITSQLRIRTNEAYLFGGLISRSVGDDTAGYPWLSRIPIIGWLFGNRTRQRTETELLIMVRPIIVRPAAAEEFASRSIFFGKELSGLPAPVPIPAPQQEQPAGAEPEVPEGAPDQPGTAPAPGQPSQPGAIPFPGPFPPGFPFPGGALPPGIGIQPGQSDPASGQSTESGPPVQQDPAEPAAP